VVVGSTSTDLKKTSELKPIKGSLKKFNNELMNSIIENNKQSIEDGKLIKESINVGIGLFTPNLLFEQLVKNYAMAEKIFGESIIRKLTDYDPSYVKKNIKIPEFQREIKKNIRSNIEGLKDRELIDEQGAITEQGVELASLILYKEELDNLTEKGILGEKVHKKNFRYGEKQDIINYKKGHRYRDIALKESVKLAIKRQHNKLIKDDLRVFKRKSKGQACIIYCLDASGSMKGEKIDSCKKAGVALAYKAITEKDKVGLLVFGSDIRKEIPPTHNFVQLLKTIIRIRATKETNIAKTIDKAIQLFPKKEITKHLIIISDALPTFGKKPEKETIEKAALAKNHDITISFVGINLDEKGEKLAKKIVEIGQGNLYITKNIKELDKIILEDYYSII